MKFTSFLILLMLVLKSDVSPQWIDQSISEPYNLIFSSSFFYNLNTGYLPNHAPQRLIAKTTNGGINWITDSVSVGRISSITFSGKNGGLLNTSFPPRESYFHKTTDSGNNWNLVGKISDNYVYCIVMIDSNTIIGSADSGKIYRSTNFGNNWSVFNTGINVELWDVHFPSAQTGYTIGKFGNWFKTTNEGVSWFQGSSLPVNDLYKVFFVNNDTGFATGISQNIWRTVNGGFSWQAYPTGAGGEMRCLFFPSTDTGYVISNYTIGKQSYHHFLKTTNCGESWQIIPNGIAFGGFRTMFFVNNDVGWIAGGGSRIYKTTTGGLTFISNTSTEIPYVFFLSQNYPNPFNPVTKIRFGIPFNSDVRLTVFDLLGRVTKVLHEGNISAGEYEFSFSASELPTGVYFYRLETENFSDVKRMVILK